MQNEKKKFQFLAFLSTFDFLTANNNIGPVKCRSVQPRPTSPPRHYENKTDSPSHINTTYQDINETMAVTFVSNNMSTTASYSSSQSNTTQADSVTPQDLNASK